MLIPVKALEVNFLSYSIPMNCHPPYTAGQTVVRLVEALRYRKVAGSIPDGVIRILH
jgi:hypothetical protein